MAHLGSTACPNPTALLRNLPKRPSLQRPVQEATSQSKKHQNRTSSGNGEQFDILAIKDPRYLTYTQSPRLRIEVKGLIPQSRTSTLQSDICLPRKRKLDRQYRCQARLTITHDQDGGDLGDEKILFRDSQNGIIRLSQAAEACHCAIVMDDTFDIQATKLLVLNGHDDTWEVKMAKDYSLHITLRLLDPAEISEFLLSLHEHDIQAPFGKSGVLQTTCSMPLATREMLEPMCYICNGKAMPSRFNILASSTLCTTSQSQLELYKAMSKPKPPLQPDCVAFVWGTINPRVLTPPGFQCPLCDGKSFLRADSLEIHLRKMHKMLSFSRKDVIHNKRLRMQITVSHIEHKARAVNGVSVSAISSDSTISSLITRNRGGQTWLQDGEWFSTDDTWPISPHKRRKLNGSLHESGSPTANVTKATKNLHSPQSMRLTNGKRLAEENVQTPQKANGNHCRTPILSGSGGRRPLGDSGAQSGSPLDDKRRGSALNNFDRNVDRGPKVRPTNKEAPTQELLASRVIAESPSPTGIQKRTPSSDSRSNVEPSVQKNGLRRENGSVIDAQQSSSKVKGIIGRSPLHSVNHTSRPPTSSSSTDKISIREAPKKPSLPLKSSTAAEEMIITQVLNKRHTVPNDDDVVFLGSHPPLSTHFPVRVGPKADWSNDQNLLTAGQIKIERARIAPTYTNAEMDKLIKEVGQLPKPQRPKHSVPAPPKGVNLFRTATKRRFVEGEIISESEDEVDHSWSVRRHEETIDAHTDMKPVEKTFVKRWDAYFAKEQLCSNKHAADAVFRFAVVNKRWLHNQDMRTEFSLKLAAWFADGMISWLDIHRCWVFLDSKERTSRSSAVEQAAQTRTSRTGSAVWLSGCSCGHALSAAEMQNAISCANLACPSPDFHLTCLGLSSRPTNWKCAKCTKTDSKGGP